MQKATTFLIFFLAFVFLVPQIVVAQGLVPCGQTRGNPCTFCDFFKLFENIIDFVLFRLVPPLAMLMLAIGGAMFFLAAGDPDKLGQARRILTSVVLGLIIIYTAWLLVNLFFTSISGSVGFNPTVFDPSKWFEFQCR